MAYNFFALMGRMKYIDRWGLMRNTQVENIQEHSHMVAVLAHALAVIGRERFGGTVDPGQAAAAALFHDAPEILTGDLPTPVKYYSPQIKESYKEIEQAAAGRLLSTLPPDLQQAYRPHFFEQDPQVLSVVKAADKLSALVKCIEEIRMGNNDFQNAKQAQLEALRQMNLPAVDFFLENCLPSYELTLDELNLGNL